MMAQIVFKLSEPPPRSARLSAIRFLIGPSTIFICTSIKSNSAGREE
ncbi:hypothetical protein A2U01_0021724, partial [Trifolium medium]|nr:hypothetical protein [Trifolium medium]